MKRALATFCVALGVLASVPLSTGAQQADLELLVIANPQGTPAALSEAELRAVFTSRMRYWGSGTRAVPFNLPPSSAGRTAFDRVVLHMSPDQAARFWIDQRVRGGDPPPRQVPSPELMTRVVARLPGSIGYVPVATPTVGVRVVARVQRGQVVAP